MLYRLCRAGLAPYPDYLRDQLHAGQIAGWLAYAEVEPWGSSWTELLHGILCQTIANSGLTRPDPPAEVTDFMPTKIVEIVEMEPMRIMANAAEWSLLSGHRKPT